MVKRIDKIPILLFLFLSAVLIFCWFRFGHIYGGGDTGLPLYNPKVMANLSTNIWWESLAPGIPVAQGLTSVPVLYILSIPQMLGASPIFIQGLLFFTLLFLMGYGMYSLALSIFGRSNNLMALAAGVFYMFNPYMMIQIWHRFIHNSMFFVAFLPYLVMTWLLWIRKRNPIYLLLFLLVNFLAVYVYGSIAFIVTVWTLLILLTLMEAIFPWKGKKEALKLSLAFLIGFVLWLLTNSWWVIPTFNISPTLFATQHTTDDSLSTLMELSAQTTLPYTLRLINPFYLYWHADWGQIYQNLIFLITSWLFVVVTFVGFFKGLTQRKYAIWSVLFLVIIYLSKGAAPPFNFPYIFGFSHFFPLGVIRNPFEKLGILLPFIYAICFALGLGVLLTYSVKLIGKTKTTFLLTFFILVYIALLHPMFAGSLFGTLDKQNFVEVPKSYTQTNDWIKQDIKGTVTAQEGRILHLPLPTSEGAAYNWKYGYNGVDPSAAIFTSLPSIARGLDLPYVSDALSGLSLIFHKPYALNNQTVILKMLQDFNVKYIILHKDIEWLGGELYNPKETETVLDKLDFLTKEETFGDLIVYKLKDSYFSPKIILSDNVQLLYPSKKNLFWPWVFATPSAQIVNTVDGQQGNNILERANKVILLPEKSSTVKNLEVPEFQGNLDNFNNIRLLPNSPWYPLIGIKEQLSLIGESGIEQQRMRIVFAEKRLVEVYKIKRMRELGIINSKTGDQLIDSLLKNYQSLLIDIFKDELMVNNITIGNQSFSIVDTFLKHMSLLEELNKSSHNEGEKEIAGEIISLINRYMVKSGLLPKYALEDENGLVKDYRQQSTFNVPFKSAYELLMIGSNVKSIYPNLLSELTFQINDINQKYQEEDKGAFASFGKKEFDSGEYQISLPRAYSVNLIPALSQWSKVGTINISDSTGTIEISSGEQNVSYIEADIKPVYGKDLYLISFDLKIESGKGIRIEVNQDTDQIEKKTGEVLLRYNNYYTPTVFDKNGWSHFEAIISLQPTTQKAKLKIQAEPWDDCLTVLGDRDKCSDQKVREVYNQPSKFLIKNIGSARLLNNDIFLTANMPVDITATPSGTVLEVNKQTPSNYFGKVRIFRPTFIFFKESFNPGWELKLDGQILPANEHLVGNLFANVWFIDKVGDYDFTLNFNPQKLINLGIELAFLGWTIALIVIVGYNFRRLIHKK